MDAHSLAPPSYALALALALATSGACSQTPAPACPTPAAVVEAPRAEPDEVTPDDAAADAAARMTSPDGLYACARPTGEVQLVMRPGFTAKDLVVAYLGITCAHVILPVELADRSRAEGFDGRLKPAEIEPRFRALFEDLGLSLVRERGAAIVVDPSWLVRRPGLLLVQRADAASVLLSSSPSIPPPLDPSGAVTGITRVGEHHHRIAPAAVPEVIAAGVRGARLTPSIKNGQRNGVKLYAIRPGSFYARVGFMNGDTVHALNGVDLIEPARLAPDYLLASTPAVVTLTRRGKPVTLVIEIAD